MPRLLCSLASGIVAIAFVLGGCAGAPSILDPQGPAARIAGLGWLLFILGGAIYLAVIGLLFLALFRQRPHLVEDAPASNEAKGTRGPSC